MARAFSHYRSWPRLLGNARGRARQARHRLRRLGRGHDPAADRGLRQDHQIRARHAALSARWRSTIAAARSITAASPNARWRITTRPSSSIRISPHAYNKPLLVGAVLGRTEQAAADCTRVLKLHNIANTFENRGFIYLKRGEFDRAIADYEAGLRLDPPNKADFLYGRGLARKERRRGATPTSRRRRRSIRISRRISRSTG
jgi:tetratricopeptide (TPR) repeat protein